MRVRGARVLASALASASLLPGREKDLGIVEPGKVADLLALGADPTLDVAAFRRLSAVVGGGVVRSLDELHRVASSPVEAPR